jgi:hypothetical protein
MLFAQALIVADMALFTCFLVLDFFRFFRIGDQVSGGVPKTMATDPVISGPWPFGAFEGF